jgi:hypothetical protein
VLWRFFSALRSPDAEVRKEAKRKARFAVICLIAAISGTVVAAKAYTEVDLRIGDAGRSVTRNRLALELPASFANNSCDGNTQRRRKRNPSKMHHVASPLIGQCSEVQRPLP